jgi:actin-related protein
MFWANIGLIGGNTKFPGFRTRLYVFCDFVLHACMLYAT